MPKVTFFIVFYCILLYFSHSFDLSLFLNLILILREGEQVGSQCFFSGIYFLYLKPISQNISLSISHCNCIISFYFFPLFILLCFGGNLWHYLELTLFCNQTLLCQTQGTNWVLAHCMPTNYQRYYTVTLAPYCFCICYIQQVFCGGGLLEPQLAIFYTIQISAYRDHSWLSLRSIMIKKHACKKSVLFYETHLKILENLFQILVSIFFG